MDGIRSRCFNIFNERKITIPTQFFFIHSYTMLWGLLLGIILALSYVLVYLWGLNCQRKYGKHKCAPKIRPKLRFLYVALGVIYLVRFMKLIQFQFLLIRGNIVTRLILPLLLPTINHLFVEKHTLWLGLIYFSWMAVMIVKKTINEMTAQSPQVTTGE